MFWFNLVSEDGDAKRGSGLIGLFNFVILLARIFIGFGLMRLGLVGLI